MNTESFNRPFSAQVTEIVRQRYSCRTYENRPIAPETAAALAAFAGSIKSGPFGTPLRFELTASSGGDPDALKGLGTYGFIKDPAGFIIGAVGPGVKNLEDFGFGMEAIILRATDLGLGSCWLGGSFAKSRFAGRIRASAGEIVPAVAAIGYPAEETLLRRLMRRQIKADSRKAWETLFFHGGFDAPLAEQSAGVWAVPLEMLRLAPSASNGQPWRVVQAGSAFHFYLQRRVNYKPGSSALVPFTIADLPRVDMGIAICHFQLTAQELGLEGRWEVKQPDIPQAATLVYCATWIGKS
jgi:nitroreductase